MGIAPWEFQNEALEVGKSMSPLCCDGLLKSCENEKPNMCYRSWYRCVQVIFVSTLRMTWRVVYIV